MGILVIDEPGAVAAEKAAIVVRRFGSITDRDLPMVQAELGIRWGRCSWTTRSTSLRSKGSPRGGKAIRIEVLGLHGGLEAKSRGSGVDRRSCA